MEHDQLALKTALNLINKRWYTTFEITEKLAQKQFSSDEIAKTVQFLESHQFLDDRRFTRSFIKDHQTFQREGKLVITQKLIKKGIAKDLIAQAWLEIKSAEPTETDSEVAVALEAARSKIRSYQHLEPAIARRRLLSFLARKGFSYNVIKAALALLDEQR